MPRASVHPADPVPATGERVTVKGRVNELAMVAGQTVGLHLDEEQLRFKE